MNKSVTRILSGYAALLLLAPAMTSAVTWRMVTAPGDYQ
jgi:hypothetical protein